MFWEEDTNDLSSTESQHVVDISYKISCRCLPVDHAHALSEALKTALDWLEGEPLAGLHLVHVAGSQNGWMRPEAGYELLQLSKRTRLQLRVPKHRIEDAKRLSGQTLDVAGHQIEVSESHIRPLQTSDVLFSRYVITDFDDEIQFEQWAVDELRALDIRFRKTMAGMRHTMHISGQPVVTCSLLVADLPAEDSIKLQETGLGAGRTHGCGIFIPHKGIKAVDSSQ
ncbi:MAG: hypothetical protein BMS9Abin15_1055 [Gammaproteobacteria bacterium]|nr:MAG: hypothetical protein BMS9Abin15_1055 [Gammaproteobacteria bacterium]